MTFISLISADGGFSSDKKYRAIAADGKEYFLRISPVVEFERRKQEFEIMKLAYDHHVSMCEPIELSLEKDGVHTILEWVNGLSAECVMPTADPCKRYQFGVDAGKNLRLIHSVPAPESSHPIGSYQYFEDRLNINQSEFESSGIKFNDLNGFKCYLYAKRGMLMNRPNTLQHNDFHIGNLMIDGERLYIIDFADFSYGDPWGDFASSIWTAQYYPEFVAGQVDGYFDGNPPDEFWRLLAYYTAAQFPTYILWAKLFGADEVNNRINQAQSFLQSIQDSDVPIPSWYLANYS